MNIKTPLRHRYNPVQKAIRAAGGRKALSEYFGISYEAIRRWEVRRRVPARHVLELVKMVRASGRVVTPHQICPEVFTDPKWMPVASK